MTTELNTSDNQDIEMDNFKRIINSGTNERFIHHFDDMHFHRSYSNNENLVLIAEKQLQLV
jgi:hypothetical protein